MIAAPLLVRDRRTNVAVWLDAEIAYCKCGSASLVEFPTGALPLPGEATPPGRAETLEGRQWLNKLRAALREGPDDREARRVVATAWYALDPGARLDAVWALTREEHAWLILACDETLGLR